MLKRLFSSDPPYHALGYPNLDGLGGYNPLVDQSISPEEGVKRFPIWASGYYKHGETAAELEPRIFLAQPRPTIETMTLEDIQSAFYPGPGNPGGSDATLMTAGLAHGSLNESRLAAYFPPETSTSEWDNVKLKHIWCDQTVWETPWAKLCVEKEFEEANEAGKRIRPYEIVRMRQANHFVSATFVPELSNAESDYFAQSHWDQPERALLVLLGDDKAAETV